MLLAYKMFLVFGWGNTAFKVVSSDEKCYRVVAALGCLDVILQILGD